MSTEAADRVRVIIVDDGRIALIRRTREDRDYHVLPGGGVEPGETPERAAHREVEEELGVRIELGERVHAEERRGERQVYFRARIVGGEFGTGTWPDHAAQTAEQRAAHGGYEAVWVPIADLDGLDVQAPLPDLLAGRTPMRIDRLDHLVLTVADIERTCRFYHRVLGMVPIRFGEGGHRRALSFGRQQLNLHQVGREFEPKAARPTAGSADLCLVSGVPLTVVIDALDREGVPVELGPVPRTGALGAMTSVYFRDPDQNLIEVAAYDG